MVHNFGVLLCFISGGQRFPIDIWWLLTTFWTLTFEFGFSFILLFCTLLLQVFLNEKHTHGEKLFILLCSTILSLCLLPWSLVLFYFFNSFVLCLVALSFYWLKAHTKQQGFKRKNNILSYFWQLCVLGLYFGIWFNFILWVLLFCTLLESFVMV